MLIKEDNQVGGGSLHGIYMLYVVSTVCWRRAQTDPFAEDQQALVEALVRSAAWHALRLNLEPVNSHVITASVTNRRN